MKRVIFIDPGEKCGWARADVDEQGNWYDLRHGISALKDMALALYRVQVSSSASESRAYDVVGHESYRVYAHKAKEHIGSPLPTAQMIGMIRLVGWVSGAKLIDQPASRMEPARKSAPTWLTEYLKKFPKRHDEAHDESALLHLWAWTFKNTPATAKTHRRHGGKDV